MPTKPSLILIYLKKIPCRFDACTSNSCAIIRGKEVCNTHFKMLKKDNLRRKESIMKEEIELYLLPETMEEFRFTLEPFPPKGL